MLSLIEVDLVEDDHYDGDDDLDDDRGQAGEASYDDEIQDRVKDRYCESRDVEIHQELGSAFLESLELERYVYGECRERQEDDAEQDVDDLQSRVVSVYERCESAVNSAGQKKDAGNYIGNCACPEGEVNKELIPVHLELVLLGSGLALPLVLNGLLSICVQRSAAGRAERSAVCYLRAAIFAKHSKISLLYRLYYTLSH